MSDKLSNLKDAVSRSEKGDGFHFSTPKDFNTDGAFYRDQVDLTNLKSMMAGDINRVMGMGHPAPQPDNAPAPEGSKGKTNAQMVDDLLKGVGFEAVSRQHGAMWLRNGEIEAAKHVELTGNAKDSLLGSLVYSSPKKLMTAEGGPFEIIGEAAFANPGEYARASMDFALNSIAPFVTGQMGITQFDATPILGLLGLGNADVSKLAQEVYVMATSSSRRGGNMYLPGLVAAVHTDGDDLRYIMVNLIDSAGTMAPAQFPFAARDFGDQNAKTWVSNDPSLPFTPTLAWTDGWLVESLWREDAIAARDALANGSLLKSDKMPPVNFRMRFNRQKLMRGFADILYEIPEPEVAYGGAVAEILALLSAKDERLLVETVNGDNFTESRCKFSIGLFQDLIPALAYAAKGSQSEWSR
jgi:hypothetical protein